MASHDTAKDSARRDAEQARLEATKAIELIEALKVGKDLSTQERQIVGSWSFDQGLVVGEVTYDANRRWRLNTSNGQLTLEGTWKIADNVLLQTVEKSSESEQAGRVIQGDILELIDDKRLVIRDKEGGDTLTFRPIIEMSDIEKSLLGGWKLEGLPTGAEADEMVFGRLHFWTDRSWALDGKVMDKAPSEWKVLDRTLILLAANKEKKLRSAL